MEEALDSDSTWILGREEENKRQEDNKTTKDHGDTHKSCDNYRYDAYQKKERRHVKKIGENKPHPRILREPGRHCVQRPFDVVGKLRRTV